MLKIMIIKKDEDYITIIVYPECLDDGNDFEMKIDITKWEIIYSHAKEEQRIYTRQAIIALKSEIKRKGLEGLPSSIVSEWY